MKKTYKIIIAILCFFLGFTTIKADFENEETNDDDCRCEVIDEENDDSDTMTPWTDVHEDMACAYGPGPVLFGCSATFID